MPVSIYEDLYTWSETLEPWQQDALRRIVQSDLLSQRDTEELGQIAYRAATERRRTVFYAPANHSPVTDDAGDHAAVPLNLTHLPARSSSAPPVTLKTVRHISGVNRLQPDAEIPFVPTGLNVIYGFNASGKSGFTRILKRACHSRAPEQIVSNVFTDAPEQPRASVTYLLGDEEQTHTWDLDKDSPDANLPRVAVYDNRGALVHFQRSGAQLELLPPGLDMLPRLSDLYVDIAEWARLELARRRAVPTPEVHRNATSLRANMDAVGTEGAIDALQALSSLTNKESAELASLPGDIQVLESGTRKTRIASETLRESQFRSQAARIATALDAFADDQVAQLSATASSYAEALREASAAPKPPGELLAGVHGTHWSAMWRAALEYAIRDAYPGTRYQPEVGSLCLLCQQPLDEGAARRLQRYAAQETESAVGRLLRLDAAFRDILRGMTASGAGDVLDVALLAVLPEGAGAVAEAATSALGAAGVVAARLAATTEPALTPEDEASLRAAIQPLSDLRDQLVAEADRAQTSIEALSAQSDDPAQVNVKRERLRLLQERAGLQENMEALIALHEAQVEMDALNEVLDQCNTQAVSRKSSTVSAAYVTDICEGFSKEAALLGGFDISASMTPLTTQRGVRRTGIVLRQAKRTSVAAEHVLSEGELRVMSLAAFFADLRGSGDTSAIVLDDPMTSLDHRFQEMTAQRLVREARSRQVIVFTHSTAFLSALQSAIEDDPTAQIAEGLNPPEVVPLSVIEVTRDRRTGFAGIKVDSFLTATNVLEERVKHLKALAQTGQSHWDASEMDEYERSIESFARHLRGTWETAVEDLLLCKVVRRNRNSVTTERRISGLIGITPEEVATVTHGMDVESFYVHSTPEGAEKESPTPDDLRKRVTELTDWMKQVKTRQKDMRATYPL